MGWVTGRAEGSGTAPGGRSLRSILVALVLALVLPSIVAGAVTSWRLAADARRVTEARLQDTARALALFIESEVDTNVAVARTIASSPFLAPEAGLPALEAWVRALAPTIASWVVVHDATPGFPQILNTALPPNAPLPPPVAPGQGAFAVLQRAMETRDVAVSGFLIGRGSGRPAVVIAAPVLGPDGTVLRLVVIALDPAQVAEKLRARSPEGAFVSVSDAEGRIIARSQNQDRLAGVVPPSRSVSDAERARRVFRAVAVEGYPALFSAQPIRNAAGWALVVGMPEQGIVQRLLSPLLAQMAFGLGILLVGTAAALLLARRILRPIASLVAQARAVTEGSPPAATAPGPTGIFEFDALRHGFQEAQSAMEARGAALAESENRLRLFVERAPAAIAMFDRDMRYLAVSRRFLADLRLDDPGTESLIGRSHYEVFPNTPEQWRDAHRRALLGETLAADEDPLTLADGRTDWFRWELVPWRREDGTIGGVMLSSEVVTERMEARLRLAASEARFRAMADSAPALIWTTDENGRCTYISRQWRLFTGQAENDALGLGWLDAVHPEDRERTRAVFLEASARATSYRVEMRLWNAARQEWAWVIDAASPWLGPDGRFLGYVGAAIDISERRQAEARLAASEARFRVAVRAVSGILWTNNARGEMEGEQEGWAALTGQSFEEYQGTGWAKAVHPDDVAPSIAAWSAAVTKGDVFQFEHRVRRHDGEWRRFAIRALPVRSPEGEVIEWVGVHTDVTDQREAEAVLARGKAELERLVEERTRDLRETEARLAQALRVEALGRLAGGIAHDINNVLQAVQGAAGLMERRPGDEAATRRLARMTAEAAERGASITRRLLAFSRLGDLRADAVPPADLLADMGHLLGHTLGDAIAVRIEAPEALPPLLADRRQLETVLINFATNARDAMPEGGTLTLSARAVEAPGPDAPPGLAAGRYVQLSTSDDGPGMTPDILARVTEPFFTTKPQGQGTGLGLAMAKGFAEQSGGALTIESTPGRGTVASLFLPVASASPLAAGPEETPRAASRGRILLVDDDPIVREVTAEQLCEDGYEVVSASSGATALEMLEEASPDLLLTDLSMPEMDGATLIREAQARRPGLPALLLTGFADRAADLAEGGERGFALLRKPATAQELATSIALLLERRAA
ncbi:PAS domain S-box protein [Sabulicella rubraurantiaca]|uniref:PAS domain S-box protein n=1 Tax=Sabulicella rubraurantiaca TaxID=2811429 RepID=UPI001A96A281|nr:PAS domain S-box protein [Sabulicella rubraurantiaca]